GVASIFAETNQPPSDPLTAPEPSDQVEMWVRSRCTPGLTPLATSVMSISKCSGPPNGVMARTSSIPGGSVSTSGSSRVNSKLRSNASQFAGQFSPSGGGLVAFGPSQLSKGKQVVSR